VNIPSNWRNIHTEEEKDRGIHRYIDTDGLKIDICIGLGRMDKYG
jgi:hypothetical protein